MYSHMLVHESLIENDDIEPRSVEKFQRRVHWPEWKDAIQVELDSLTKRTVFEPGVPIPSRLKPVE
jgi:hypothetical protein